MSHVVTIKCEIKNLAALERACERLNLQKPQEGTHKLYSGSHRGLGIHLDGWNYPIIVNPQTGEVHYDNFGGSWGNQLRLDELQQAYTAEVTSAWASQSGYMVEQETLESGEIRMTLSQLV